MILAWASPFKVRSLFCTAHHNNNGEKTEKYLLEEMYHIYSKIIWGMSAYSSFLLII